MSAPSWRWFAGGLVVGAVAVGAWWSVERNAWVAASLTALERAETAEAESADLRTEVVAGMVWADSVRRAAEAEVAKREAAERRAARASATADLVTAQLAVAASAADSIPLLLARDTARVAELDATQRQVAAWRTGYEAQRARGDSLAVLVAEVQGDAARLVEVNRDLQRRIAAGVPKPSKILGLSLPSRGAMFVLGVAAGAVACSRYC